jgi:hypothetical protein
VPGTFDPPELAVASNCALLRAVPTVTGAGVVQLIVGVTGIDGVLLPLPQPFNREKTQKMEIEQERRNFISRDTPRAAL